MAEKSVKVLRSIGTVAGVLNTGDVVSVDEGMAESWVQVGFAEYADKAAPQVETPEDKLAMEVAVDGPDETKGEPKGAQVEPAAEGELDAEQVEPKKKTRGAAKK